MKVFIDRDELWPSYSLVPMNREPLEWNLWCEVDEMLFDRYNMVMKELNEVTELLGKLYDEAENARRKRQWGETDGTK